MALRRYKNWFTSNTNSGQIFRNMLLLTTGAGAGKAVGFLTLPLVTRIYSPDSMGALSVFVSFAALLVPFGTLRFSAAIPLPRNDAMALNLVAATIFLSFCTTFIIALLLWGYGAWMLALLNMTAVIPYWWLLPLMVLTSAVYEVFFSWTLREKKFQRLATSKVVQSIVGAVTKIGLGLLGLKSIGLIFGHVFMQAGGLIVLAPNIASGFWRVGIKKLSIRRIVFLLKFYIDYPKYRLPAQFLLALSSQAPLLFTAWIYGSESTGQLGLALTTLALPLTLFGYSTGQAYYAEIAKIGKGNRNLIYKITKDVTLKLFLLSLPPFVILLVFGPFIFRVIFGEQWEDAGVFARILATYLMAQFVSSPLVNVLSVLNKQKLFFKINAVRVVIIIFIFVCANYFKVYINQALIIYSLVLAAHYFFISILVFRVINEDHK